ncbi:MAG: thiamine pyrophosphate-binding protein [Polyangia bacterium]
MTQGPMLGGHAAALAIKTAGVSTIFTLCGGHICALYDGCIDHGIEVIDVRHEQAAVHAADAWARVTRGLGVAVVTAGPGVTDAVTGVVAAWFAQSPVLIIAGAPKQGLMGRGTLQEMDQVTLFEKHTKAQFICTSPDRVAELVSQAAQIALSGVPGPVFVEIPFDVMVGKTEVTRTHQAEFKALPQGADPSSVERLAAMLDKAEKPVLFCGSSIWWDGAADEVRKLVALGLPLYVNGMGRGVLPPTHDGLYALSREHAFRNTDALVLVGAPLDFRMGYGEGINAAAHIGQIDRDAKQFGKNRRSDVMIHADSKSALGALASALEKRGTQRWSDWRKELRSKENEKRERQLAWERDDGAPMNQFRIGRAIQNTLDENTIVVGDGGYVVTLAAKVISPLAIGNWLDPGAFGTLGVGPPFALAAKRARPDAHIVLLLGDGAFGLNGFDLETCVRFDCPMTVVVGNDAAWGQILIPQIQSFGRERAIGSRLAPIRYDKVVEAFGGAGEHVDSGPELDAALRRARDSGKVYCIDARVDQEFVLREKLARTTVL